MKHITIIALLVLGATTAVARLGETTNQCAQRYGATIEPSELKDGILLSYYRKAGINILVAYTKDTGSVWRAGAVSYTRPGQIVNEPLSAEEVRALLAANSHASTWKEVDYHKAAERATSQMEKDEAVRSLVRYNSWVRADEKAEADYDKRSDMLIIVTREFREFHARNETNPMSGF